MDVNEFYSLQLISVSCQDLSDGTTELAVPEHAPIPSRFSVSAELIAHVTNLFDVLQQFATDPHYDFTTHSYQFMLTDPGRFTFTPIFAATPSSTVTKRRPTSRTKHDWMREGF